MTRRNWLIPTLLMVFAVMPLIPGAFRLVELGGGPHLLPANPRASGAPLPVIIHIVSAFFFTVFGAWQFSPALRRQAWHRRAGRLLAPLGLAAALTGLWMTLGYPTAPEYDAMVIVPVRLVVGSLMAASIVLALIAIIGRRDVPAHRAWMMRAYAIGLGAATQMVIFIPLAPFGTPEPFTASLLLTMGWVINLAVAEWLIRRDTRTRRAPIAVAAE